MVDRVGRILLVEDNKVNRLLLERTLVLQGHEVATVEDGRSALDKLCEDDRFDLVVLDIQMPRMNGFEVLAELKNAPALRDLPVVVTSSLEEIDDIVRCIELGADDYLAKPVNGVLLKARITALLEKKQLRDEQAEMIRRLATPEVAADLQTSGFAIGGQRVQVSVAFVDIRGFTSLSETLSPEATIELLNDYYTLTFDAITSNHGLVNQMIGDGLMAVFGAPRPVEAHAACAVRAALEMVEVILQFSESRVAAGLDGIEIGVGIATGEVIAGYTGTSRRAVYTCIGDAVNLAARLEGHTKQAGRPIVLDAATKHAAADADVTFASLGEIEIRGKAQPVDVYAVDAP